MPYDLETHCGGTGMLNCFCAGDFCACGLNGEAICTGCPDCYDSDDDDDFGYDELTSEPTP